MEEVGLHDEGFFRAFEGTMRDFIVNSSLARGLLAQADAAVLCDPDFLRFMNAQAQG